MKDVKLGIKTSRSCSITCTQIILSESCHAIGHSRVQRTVTTESCHPIRHSRVQRTVTTESCHPIRHSIVQRTVTTEPCYPIRHSRVQRTVTTEACHAKRHSRVQITATTAKKKLESDDTKLPQGFNGEWLLKVLVKETKQSMCQIFSRDCHV